MSVLLILCCCAALNKHSNAAIKQHGTYKMVRFVPFIAGLLTLGVAAGDPLPSSKGKRTRLPVRG